MSDIKTITQEITDLSLNIKEAILNGENKDLVEIMEKIIEKLDEVIEKVNE
jgi:hypothetical protein